LNTDGLSDKEFSDPALLRVRSNMRFVADFALGYRRENFNFTLTFPHLYRKAMQSAELSLAMIPQSFHYVAAASYRFDISENLALEPQILYKKGALKKGQTDLSLRAVWNKMLWLGTMYRSNFGYSLMTGVNIKNFSLAYAIEISPQERGARGGSSHEILLAYNLPNLKSKNREAKTAITDSLKTENIAQIEKTDTLKTDLKEVMPATESTQEVFEKGKNYVLSEVKFKEGTAELTAEGKNALDKFVEAIEKLDLEKIEITAHTDNSLNALTAKLISEQRANAVANYLVKQGISRKIIFATGMANSKPIFKNPKSEAEDKQNDRIEVQFE
jgi:outer membrane protein OmpA-like peptidoglycan-associated protein